MRHFCNYTCKRGLAAAGRPMENYRGQTISFDCPAQQFARRKNVFLADKFVERARPYARGEWSSAIRGFYIRLFGK